MLISEKLKRQFWANERAARPRIRKWTSLLAKDLILNGDIHIDGDINIDGRVSGNVTCEKLVIGRFGYVDGQIRCKEAEIHGKVTGAISANDIVLTETAKVSGDVIHKTLSIRPGAVVDGFYRQKKAKTIADRKGKARRAGQIRRQAVPKKHKRRSLKKPTNNPVNVANGASHSVVRKTIH